MATTTCGKQPEEKKSELKLLICLAFSCNHWAVVSCLTYASTKVDPFVESWREGELFENALTFTFGMLSQHYFFRCPNKGCCAV